MSTYTNKINIKPWIKNTEINAVLTAITRDGKEARFIGGCVRNHILGKPVNDIDIATQEPPNRIVTLLNGAGIKAIPIGIQHGTITAIINNKKFEITTLRRDMETNGRQAVVEYTKDWEQDAARRDFTINAISVDLDGNIFDYFTGQQDLSAKVIRFIGDAPSRIKEDYLRILRYFRFIATLGLEIGDQRDLNDCVDNASKLRILSAERIRSELFKILSSKMKKDIMQLMYHRGVLSIILPHATSPDRLMKLSQLETNNFINESTPPDPIRRLAALTETNLTGVAKITAALKLSKIEKNRLTNLKRRTNEIRWNMTNNELRRVVYKRGPTEVIDLAFLNWADTKISRQEKNIPKAEEGWQNVILNIQKNIEKTLIFPINGQDVIDHEIPPSKKVSQLLGQVEEWWLNNGCIADRKACLKKLEMIIDLI